MEQKGILVVGMHRSGTSCMAGCLYHSGVHFRPLNRGELLGPKPSNPKGHFEHLDFVHFHNRILQSKRLSWNHIEGHEQIKHSLFIDDLKRLVMGVFSGVGLFAIKDPRILLIHDLYIRVFEEMEIDLHVVRMKRPCKEVAGSLCTRNMMISTHAVALCEKYNRIADEFCGKVDSVVEVEFKELIKDPETEMKRVKYELDVPLFIDVSKLGEFVDPKLKHW